MGSLAGLEPLSLRLDVTEYRTVGSLLHELAYSERIELLRNRLGLGWRTTYALIPWTEEESQ